MGEGENRSNSYNVSNKTGRDRHGTKVFCAHIRIIKISNWNVWRYKRCLKVHRSIF